MSQIIALIIVCLAVISYFYITQRRFKKYDFSVTNYMIDRLYNMWYAKNSVVINKRNISVFEIDRELYQFKKELEKKGITTELVREYISVLKESKKTQKFDSKDLLIGILGAISANAWINKQIEEVSVKDIFNFVSNEAVQEIFKIVLQITLLILFVPLLIVFMYVLSNLDVVHKKNQKLYLLERLAVIWDYQINKSVDSIEGIFNGDDFGRKIFLNLKSPKSNFDIRFDKSIGVKVTENATLLNEILLNTKNTILSFFSGLIDFVLGFILPLFLLVATFLLFLFEFSLLSQVTNNIVTVALHFFIITSILVMSVLWLIVYDSQVNTFVTQSKKIKEFGILEIYAYKSKSRKKRGWLQGFIYVFVLAFLGKIVIRLYSGQDIMWLFKLEILVQYLLIVLLSLGSFFCTIKRNKL